jgi:hypothetical protein
MLVLVNLSVKKSFVFFRAASTSVMCLIQENAFNTPSPAFSHVMGDFCLASVHVLSPEMKPFLSGKKAWFASDYGGSVTCSQAAR